MTDLKIKKMNKDEKFAENMQKLRDGVSDIKKSKYNLSMLIILTVVFIILKLTNVINWSWWLVCLPLFSPMLIVLLIIAIFMLIIPIIAIFSKK